MAKPGKPGKPGRNDPCPCGSGLKFKRCCMGKADESKRYTREDRAAALAALERFSEDVLQEEDDAAFDELWGDDLEGTDGLDEHTNEASEAVCDMWFFFDRPLDDGALVVDRLLEADPSIPPGQRKFLELARGTCMRLYEAEDVRPGVSLALRDVIAGTRVIVRERSASRQLVRGAMLAARVIVPGASGEPEMERGLLPIPLPLGMRMVSEISTMLEDFRRKKPGAGDAAFFKEMPAYFHSAWISAIINPSIPHLQNTDGEDLLMTRVRFEVLDAGRLERALDACPDLERGEGKRAWTWDKPGQGDKGTILGWFRLKGEALELETNSAERGKRGRAMVEELAKGAVRHLATSHEDLIQKLMDMKRTGEGGARLSGPGLDPEEGIPPEVREEPSLDYYARYYRQWIDDPVTALDNRTPREAAGDPALRHKAIGLVRGLEGIYQEALRKGRPAYDPSWMWIELGLADGAGPKHPPPLAHERWEEEEPGLGELCRGAAGRFRGRPGFDDAYTVFCREDLEADLEIRRYLKERKERGEEGPGADAAAGGEALLARRIAHLVNYELHRKKTFWVDEALAYMLAQTDLNAACDDLRVPFSSFALVFIDRHVLSLAERLLAALRPGPLVGHILRVITVYIVEEEIAGGRVLRMGLAPDALGSDPPAFIEHEVRLAAGAKVAPLEAGLGGQDGPLPPAAVRPLSGLMHVILNAVLYATSAGVEPETRMSPRTARAGRAVKPGLTAPVFSSEEVFFLPGAIEISSVRRMQELERAPGGGQLLHRFMVRGHWRRPAASWKERHVRWIKPYWKGPDIAAVIERTYKLKP